MRRQQSADATAGSSRVSARVPWLRLAAALICSLTACDDLPWGNSNSAAAAYVSRQLIVVAHTDGEQPVRFEGYSALVDGSSYGLFEDEPQEHLMTHGRKLEEVPPGQQTVELLGIAENCAVAGDNPRSVTIPVNSAITRVTFEVTCEVDSGHLAIRTYTRGVDLDPDGYLVDFDGVDRAIGLDERLVFEEIPTGPYTVELSDVADNCAVTANNPVEVYVEQTHTTTVNFDVICYEIDALPQVFSDHFDDGALDVAWEVTLSSATDWVHGEAGTWLTVTDIVPDVEPDPDCETTAQVMLSRSFEPVGDFSARFDFAWDGEDDLLAMQVLYFALYTTDGVRISAGYNDGWGQQTGELIAYAAGEVSRTGYSSLEHSGQSHAILTRVDGALEISFDGIARLSHTIDTPVDRAQIVFRYHNCEGASGTAFFGTEEVDLARLSGAPAP